MAAKTRPAASFRVCPAGLSANSIAGSRYEVCTTEFPDPASHCLTLGSRAASASNAARPRLSMAASRPLRTPGYTGIAASVPARTHPIPSGRSCTGPRRGHLLADGPSGLGCSRGRRRADHGTPSALRLVGDVLPGVPTQTHVVEGSGDVQAEFSGHGRRCHHRRPTATYAGLYLMATGYGQPHNFDGRPLVCWFANRLSGAA